MLIVALIAYKRVQFARSDQRPFYAATKNAFLVSSNGQIQDCVRMSWEDVRARLRRKDRAWHFGDEVTHEFGILLDYNARRELIVELEHRVRELEETSPKA